MWLEIAILTSIFAIGNILFGHFEEGTPKWRRITKFLGIVGLAMLITKTFGRPWFYGFLGFLSFAVLLVHLWWLPKNGINGWTGEPKEKYYQLRGWKWPPVQLSTQAPPGARGKAAKLL
jgi:hypothetical protein